MKKYSITSFLFALLLAGCGSTNTIIDKPISFSENRIDMTKDYIRTRYQISTESVSINPKIIVLHWTAIESFEKSFEVFNRETVGASRNDLKNASDLNVSIHFLVDYDGTIYQLMPDTLMARHCIGLNYNSIGIENVGGVKGIDNLTDEQIEANIFLVKHLKKKFPQIEYLIGHHEYREFEGHPLWLEVDDNYRTEKFDPGERFMNAVRDGVSKLNLKNVGEIRREKLR